MLKDEGYKTTGAAPIYAILKEAHERATAAGAKNIEEKPIVGAPVDALVELAEEVNADLLVVGNVGLSTITGRHPGVGACERLAPGQDRRADRPHHHLKDATARRYQPRSFHSARCGRSAPSVVSSPCPG